MLDDYAKHCMFFASNLLNRSLTKMADEAFGPTGLSPTYGFLLMAVEEKPGITQKELGEALHVTPSTITRFIEKLVYKGLVTSRTEGRISRIDLTPSGQQLMVTVKQAWKSLGARYSEVLGSEQGKQVTSLLYETGRKLGQEG
ncbi:MarR family winged helix-turn-helix transcriptional regulator [Paenibacillus sp. GCM10023252]|uniref:MarR family winged helix-turn-helix transcriptional regulator n=1 Tax=Paenibacillus sp. GCM10023252 TaxID=3252649 RepID=UPI0036241FE2